MLIALSASPGAIIIPQNKTSRALAATGTQNCCTQQGPPEPTWHGWYNDPIAVFTLCLVLATSGLWLFTARLWRATVNLGEDTKASSVDQAAKMERSAAAMERVANLTEANGAQFAKSVGMQESFGRMQMRAYVTVLANGFYQDDTHVFEGRPFLKNTGHTPAHGVKWRIKSDILPVPLPDDFDFPLPDETPGECLLNSQQDGFMSAFLDADKYPTQRLPEAELADIKQGKGRGFYTWGIVTYRDVFGEARWVKFAHLLLWFPRPVKRWKPKLPDEGTARYLHRHNEAN